MESGADNQPEVLNVPIQQLWGYLTDLRNWGPLLTEKGKRPGESDFQTPPPYSIGCEVISKLHTRTSVVTQKWTLLEMDPSKGRISLKLHPNKVVRFGVVTLTCSMAGASPVTTFVRLQVGWTWTNPIFRLLASMKKTHKPMPLEKQFVQRLRKVLNA